LSIQKLLPSAVLVRGCCDVVAASRASAGSFAEVTACVFIIPIGYEKLCTFFHVTGGSYNVHCNVLHSLTCSSDVGQNTQHQSLVLFSHNVSSYISIYHSAENPEVLKAGCASSFETHSHLNKPDSTWHLFTVPCVKHTIQYKTVTLCFTGLVLHVPRRVMITGILMVCIATAHA
jgi:hypothetical protein